MARVSYSLGILRTDRVIKVAVHGHRPEFVELVERTKAEIYDDVKYALISKDAFVSDAHLTEALHELIWRHID